MHLGKAVFVLYSVRLHPIKCKIVPVFLGLNKEGKRIKKRGSNLHFIVLASLVAFLTVGSLPERVY